LYSGGDSIGDSDDDDGGGVGGANIYRRRAEPMLVSLSNLYSKEEISVCDSRPSSSPAYMSY